MRVIIGAQVYLLIVYHDEDLPRLAILGDAAVLRPPVPAAELPMVNFGRAHQHQFVHVDGLVGVGEVSEHLEAVALLLEAKVLLYRLVESLRHLDLVLAEQLSSLLYLLESRDNVPIYGAVRCGSGLLVGTNLSFLHMEGHEQRLCPRLVLL